MKKEKSSISATEKKQKQEDFAISVHDKHQEKNTAGKVVKEANKDKDLRKAKRSREDKEDGKLEKSQDKLWTPMHSKILDSQKQSQLSAAGKPKAEKESNKVVSRPSKIRKVDTKS